MSHLEEGVERGKFQILSTRLIFLWGTKKTAHTLAAPRVLSRPDIPGALLCLFMAPVPVAVWSYPDRTKLHTECTRGSCNNFAPVSRVDLGTTA